jgi:hypothetical protein
MLLVNVSDIILLFDLSARVQGYKTFYGRNSRMFTVAYCDCP